MKVNFEKANAKLITELTCGDTFTCLDTSGNKAMYMIVDANSGIFVFLVKEKGTKVFAVNLENGHIRSFKPTEKVEIVKAEVYVKK